MKRKKRSIFRTRSVVFDVGVNRIVVSNRACVNFSSNDYLGLGKHPKIVDALRAASLQYGSGGASSALICGYSELHAKAEHLFAQWLNVDRAILFSSGYAANVGLLSALCQRHDVVLSDKYCHASIIDGIILSRAKHVRYQHNNVAHLEQMAHSWSPDWIVTESVFSMEGDIAPVKIMATIAKQHQAGLIIDDAHGIGVLGETGRGIIEYAQLKPNDYTALVLPLGKAFNAMGAIVAGERDVIEQLVQFGRSYVYSTAIPPLMCVAIIKTLDVMRDELWRQQALHNNIQLFIDYAKDQGLPLISHAPTPIKSILVGHPEKTMVLQDWLMRHGYYIAAIRAPSVPVRHERLRVSINSLHSKDEIMALVDLIVQGMRQC